MAINWDLFFKFKNYIQSVCKGSCERKFEISVIAKTEDKFKLKTFFKYDHDFCFQFSID